MTETDQAQEQYTIRGSNMPRVRAKFAKLAKRAAKLHVDPPVLNILHEVSVPLRWKESLYGGGAWVGCEEEQAERHEREYVVTVTGEALALPGGWKLAGTLQHTSAGNAVRMVPGSGIDSTPFRTGDAVCDQCQTSRLRRDTYLVVNDEGTVKRVGSNCIRDFLGHGDPELIVSFASSVMETLQEMDSDREGGSGMVDRETISMPDLLAETVAAIDAHGWLSKGGALENETPTAAHALANIFATCDNMDSWHQRNCNSYHRSNARPTADQRAEADVVLTYCRDKFSAPDFRADDYEWDLKVALAREWIEAREAGIVASSVFYYRNAMEKEIKRAMSQSNTDSKHVGELKERLRDIHATVTFVREFGDETDLYGTRTLVKFITDDANVLEWWSSQSYDPEIGTKVILTGTVKKHDEFKGVKATTLARCIIKEDL